MVIIFLFSAPKKELLSKGEIHNEIEYKQISRDDAGEEH